MRSLQLIAAVAIIGMVIGNSYNGYILNYEKTGSMKQQNNNDQVSDNDMVNLLLHNYGIYNQDLDHSAKKVIQKYGKGDLLQHVTMNYQFIIEGAENFDIQQKISQNRVPIQIDLDTSSKSKLFDKIFDAKKADSLISQTRQQYKFINKRTPFYLYSTEPLVNQYFENYGIALTTKEQKDGIYWQLYDFGTLSPVSNQFNFLDCLKSEFREVYQFNAQDSTISKINSSLKIKITRQNEKSVNSFLKDVCVISKTSKMFLHEEPVNFISFYITSLAELEKTLNAQDLEFVYDMLKLSIKNAIQNFGEYFGESETFGQIVFVANNSINQLFSADKQNIQNIFNQIKAHQNATTVQTAKAPSQRRVLLTQNQPDYNVTYSLKFWFGVIITLVLFFSFFGVATMEIQKDTLLYAKFITGDANK